MFMLFPLVVEFVIALYSPHVLNIISSIAKSFPQPPLPLLRILSITEVCVAGMVKTNPNWFQFGNDVPDIFPVFPDCSRTVSVASQISKVTLIGIPLPEQPFDAAL